jgi:hypothetical protein
MLQPCHGDPCAARSSHRTLRRPGGTVKRHDHWVQEGCGGGGLFSKFVSISTSFSIMPLAYCTIVQVYIRNSYKAAARGSRVSCCTFSLHVPSTSKVRIGFVLLWLKAGTTSKDGSLAKTWIEGEWATFDAETGASFMCSMQSQEVSLMLKAVEPIHQQIAWCLGISRADSFLQIEV